MLSSCPYVHPIIDVIGFSPHSYKSISQLISMNIGVRNEKEPKENKKKSIYENSILQT